MNDYLLDVEGLTKDYIQYDNNFERFASWFGVRIASKRAYRVVDNINFKVGRGETVALIGCNGAGKSTILKLISGIVRPSCGKVQVRGRIGAILELGLGFNPEFTGRQNVLHTTGLLGIEPARALSLVPEIQEFIEIGEFFDKPLRTYSSGMSARLAFGVATAINPELLLIDEVLSVGDSYFQAKSFSRIKKIKESGASIIMVSHDLASIKTFCDRALLIENGMITADGPAAEVCDLYDAKSTNRLNEKLLTTAFKENRVITRSGSGGITIQDAFLAKAEASDQPLEAFESGSQVTLTVVLKANKNIERLNQGFLIRDLRGNDIYGTNTYHLKHQIINITEGQECRIKFNFTLELNEGSYSLSVAAVDSDIVLIEKYDWIENVIVFEVTNVKQPFSIGTSKLVVDVKHHINESLIPC